MVIAALIIAQVVASSIPFLTGNPEARWLYFVVPSLIGMVAAIVAFGGLMALLLGGIDIIGRERW